MKQHRLKDLHISEGSDGQIKLYFVGSADEINFTCKSAVERMVWKAMVAAFCVLYPH